MSLVLNVEILGEFKNLTKATSGSQTELQNLNKKITGFSKSAKRAFASIGVGLSFAFIANELGEATKAAVADRKSQELLEAAIKKTKGATDDHVVAVEAQIKNMSIMSGVVDDKIRPAFATLLRSTDDITKSTDLMALALDIAAGTGKDVETVSKALSKAVGPDGTTGALEKLVPAIKGANDPLGKLQELFDGNAKLAADTDPYKRMEIVFGEIQEEIGARLLPVLDDFSTWLSTPEGQEKLQEIVDFAKDILDGFVAVTNWVVRNKDWLLPVVLSIGAVKLAWEGVTIATGLAKAAQVVFASTAVTQAGIASAAWAAAGTAASAALVIGGSLAIAGAAGLEFKSQIENDNKNQPTTVGVSGNSVRNPAPTSSKIVPTVGSQTVAQKLAAMEASGMGKQQAQNVLNSAIASGSFKPAPTTVNINVKTVADAKSTLSSLNQLATNTGLPIKIK